jgi:hypothetical protein
MDAYSRAHQNPCPAVSPLTDVARLRLRQAADTLAHEEAEQVRMAKATQEAHALLTLQAANVAMDKRCLATLADVKTAQDALARAQATWTQANHAVELAQEHRRAAERAKHKAEDVHTASSAQLKALEKGVADAKGLVTEGTKRVQACSNKVLADTKTVSKLKLVAHGLLTTAKQVNLEMVAANAANKAVVAHKNDVTNAAYSIKAVQLVAQFTEAKRVHKHAVAAVTKARTDLDACIERTAEARKEMQGLTTAASVAQTDAQNYKLHVVADARAMLVDEK